MVGYIRQANIAGGHQQVNNGTGESSRAREMRNPDNKLLEKKDGKRLDFGAKGACGRDDSQLATVGEINRAKDTGG
jgi:hypothetical protein